MMTRDPDSFLRTRSERRAARYLAWAELVVRRGLCDPRPRPGANLYLSSSTSPILTGSQGSETRRGEGSAESWSWTLQLGGVELELSPLDLYLSPDSRQEDRDVSAHPNQVRAKAWVLILQDIPHPQIHLLSSSLIIIIQPQPTPRTNHHSNFPS